MQAGDIADRKNWAALENGGNQPGVIFPADAINIAMIISRLAFDLLTFHLQRPKVLRFYCSGKGGQLSDHRSGIHISGLDMRDDQPRSK